MQAEAQDPVCIDGSLNPFENQVYFYYASIWAMRRFHGLNPFENQVYFYRKLLRALRDSGILES